jgi:hypothetical protein
VAKRFPFMPAFDNELVFIRANIRREDGETSEPRAVARDLEELGNMARPFSDGDGRPLRKILYEG